MVRIYCLSSITALSPTENIIIAEIKPYKNDEEKFPLNKWDDGKSAATRIKDASTTFNKYKLTEICIGYDYIIDKGASKKVYLMFIFRKDTGLLVIKMLRGSVKFVSKSNQVFELLISTTKLFPDEIDFDLKVTMRHIKNTGTKKVLSKDEEEIYENYANEIADFCKYRRELPETAIKRIPFKLENLSEANVLRTKLSDFTTLIKLLCDPHTGCFENIVRGKRYDQQIHSILAPMSIWSARRTSHLSTLNNEATRIRDCQVLQWANVNLSKLSLEDFDTQKVYFIYFQDMDLFNHKKIQSIPKCFQTMNFENLEYLVLPKCNITELSDSTLQILPSSIKYLDISDNKINSISKMISKLINLEQFNLNKNYCLSDDGFPWGSLPQNIKELGMEKTAITKVPSKIQRLVKLGTLKINNKFLEFISWKSISKTIQWISITEAKSLNAFDLLEYEALINLTIKNAGLTEDKCLNFPPFLSSLNLNNNELKEFSFKNSKTNTLKFLNLCYNRLTFMPWEDLPTTLQSISLDHNNLTTIGNISHLMKLTSFSAKSNNIEIISDDFVKLQNIKFISFTNNQISHLPVGFENINSLLALNLNINNFNSNDDNFDEKLWKRLPSSIWSLSLSQNNLHQLPCMLKDIKIDKLMVNNCNLTYICPYLITNCIKSIELQNDESVMEKMELKFQRATKTSLKNLSIVPKIIYQPFKNTDVKAKKFSKLMSKTPKITVSHENLIVTSKFPSKLSKPFYEFKQCNKENDNSDSCKCCAMCGKDGIQIEQLMIMDFDLRVLISKEKDRIFSAGEWKTNVKTNMCEKCLPELKKKIDNAYEISRQSETTVKKVKMNKKDLTNDIQGKVLPSSPNLSSISNAGIHSIKLNYIPQKLPCLKLTNFNAVDCFLIAALNVINSMEDLKISICNNSTFGNDKTFQNEMVKIFRGQTSDVQDLRKCIPSFANAEEAFLKIIEKLDENSQNLIKFSFDIIEICSCLPKEIRQAYNSLSMHLTAWHENTTFDSMLANWSRFTSRNCQICRTDIFTEHVVTFGQSQQYLIVELNVLVNASISLDNFNYKNQLIFGSLWEFISAIQYLTDGNEGHCVTWRKCHNGWMVISDDQEWHENQLQQNLENYRVLIFKKLIVQYTAQDSNVVNNSATVNGFLIPEGMNDLQYCLPQTQHLPMHPITILDTPIYNSNSVYPVLNPSLPTSDQHQHFQVSLQHPHQTILNSCSAAKNVQEKNAVNFTNNSSRATLLPLSTENFESCEVHSNSSFQSKNNSNLSMEELCAVHEFPDSTITYDSILQQDDDVEDWSMFDSTSFSWEEYLGREHDN